MSGEKDLNKLLKGMTPRLQEGDYVFCTIPAGAMDLSMADIVCYFKEEEGVTLVLDKMVADGLGLEYGFVAAWITLTVHSSLEAVGLTAAFSTALSKANISCNVIAAYYHDHIFVNRNDGKKAMEVLEGLFTCRP